VLDQGFCPRPLPVGDAAALIGILAGLEGESLIGHLDDDTTAYLQRRLAADGLLTVPSTVRDLRQALNDLAQRLRSVLGEYPSPPPKVLVD
jgi:hypothetical protein